MGFIMATTVATSRFLRFLGPEEENALLAVASPRSFERNEMVLDQDEPLRAIYLIEEGSVRVERQCRERSTPLAILVAGEFFGEMSFVWHTHKRQGSRRRGYPHLRDRRANRRQTGGQRPFLCRPALPVDRHNSCRTPSPHSMHLSLNRSWN
jgi:CRP-like cAMP-binding protein